MYSNNTAVEERPRAWEFADLVGEVFTAVKRSNDDDELIFETNTHTYKMYHSQDCCEGVDIEDIEGDLEDLLNSPITIAEEATSDSEGGSDNIGYFKVEALIKGVDLDVDKSSEGSYTWTFYRIGTAKGGVVIRWYGASNGYYSESVSVYKQAKE
jgi:hypothetical protein